MEVLEIFFISFCLFLFHFMKNFRFDIIHVICNITQELQELQRFNCACEFIDKSAVIKYQQ